MEHGRPAVARRSADHQIAGMTNLELTDEEVAVLVPELTNISWNDRYQLSSRIRTLKAILGKLKQEPARSAASPEPKVYEPPSRGRSRRRG